MQHHDADGPDRAHARDDDPVGSAGQDIRRREREVVSDRIDRLRAANRVDEVGQFQAAGGLPARRIHLQEDRPDPGVVHGVAKVAPDLRVGAATSRPPKAGTQASRHTNGTLHWAIQLISCGLWKYRLIGVQSTSGSSELVLSEKSKTVAAYLKAAGIAIGPAGCRTEPSLPFRPRVRRKQAVTVSAA
jgi:hypothetical protein